MPTLLELLPEFCLLIFSLLPLKSLIVARSVCRGWRRLVSESPIPSSRRKLLEFYYDLTDAPSFGPSRAVHEETLQLAAS